MTPPTKKLLRQVIKSMKAAHPRAIEAFVEWNKTKDAEECPGLTLRDWGGHKDDCYKICDSFCYTIFPQIKESGLTSIFSGRPLCPCRYISARSDLTAQDITITCDKLAEMIKEEGK